MKLTFDWSSGFSFLPSNSFHSTSLQKQNHQLKPSHSQQQSVNKSYLHINSHQLNKLLYRQSDWLTAVHTLKSNYRHSQSFSHLHTFLTSALSASTVNWTPYISIGNKPLRFSRPTTYLSRHQTRKSG